MALSTVREPDVRCCFKSFAIDMANKLDVQCREHLEIIYKHFGVEKLHGATILPI